MSLSQYVYLDTRIQKNPIPKISSVLHPPSDISKNDTQTSLSQWEPCPAMIIYTSKVIKVALSPRIPSHFGTKCHFFKHAAASKSSRRSKRDFFPPGLWSGRAMILISNPSCLIGRPTPFWHLAASKDHLCMICHVSF